MNLNARITKLEAALPSSIGGNKAADELWRHLNTVAKRMTEMKRSDDWYQKAAPREIAAVGLNELERGEHTPAFWERIHELSATPGPIGKLFTALEMKHAA